MYAVFREALSTGRTAHDATDLGHRYGTDETSSSVCGEHGAAWKDGDGIRSDVDEILLSELSTRDYWRAKDLIRGEPESEQERLERAKEMLERERSSDLSVYLVDLVSDSGQNADEAWRDYQVAYNQAYEDGKVSEEEQARLRDAEDYSKHASRFGRPRPRSRSGPLRSPSPSRTGAATILYCWRGSRTVHRGAQRQRRDHRRHHGRIGCAQGRHPQGHRGRGL